MKKTRKFISLLTALCSVVMLFANPCTTKAYELSYCHIVEENNIEIGQNYSTTFNDADSRCLHFTLPADGYIDFIVDKLMTRDKEAAMTFVWIFDTDGHSVWGKYFDDSSDPDPSSSTYDYRVGLSAGNYLLCLSCSSFSYLPKDARTANYHLEFTECSTYETEDNGSYGMADEIIANTMYTGVYNEEYYGDEDFYCMNLTKGHVYRVVFENFDKFRNDKSTAMFTVTDHKDIGYDAYFDFVGEGSTKTYDFVAETTDKYYFRLHNGGTSTEYRLGVYDITPSTPKLQSAKAAKKAIKVTYSKVENASGYQICCSTSKKFTAKTTKKVTVKNVATLSKKVKSLKAKKKYYVKVRAYVTVDGKKVYSGWSKTKSVKTK